MLHFKKRAESDTPKEYQHLPFPMNTGFVYRIMFPPSKAMMTVLILSFFSCKDPPDLRRICNNADQTFAALPHRKAQETQAFQPSDSRYGQSLVVLSHASPNLRLTGRPVWPQGSSYSPLTYRFPGKLAMRQNYPWLGTGTCEFADSLKLDHLFKRN